MDSFVFRTVLQLNVDTKDGFSKILDGECSHVYKVHS